MSDTIAAIKPATLVRARRRVQIALCILEDGFYDLLTTNNIAGLLAAAIEDLEDVQIVERQAEPPRGLDWNAYQLVAGE